MTVARCLIALLLLAAPGCGGPLAVLWVRIEAPLLVPEDADAVRIDVTHLTAPGDMSSTRYPLSGGTGFPLTLSLEAARDDQLVGDWKVAAEVLKGDVRAKTWAAGEGTTTLQAGKVSQVLIHLCDCP